MSSTTSIGSSILRYRQENGRTYHAYKDGSEIAIPQDLHVYKVSNTTPEYLLPNDEVRMASLLPRLRILR